jgi:hypothetical protein
MKLYIFITAIGILLWTTVIMVRLEINRRNLIIEMNDETDKTYSVEIIYTREFKINSLLTIKYKFEAITKDQNGKILICLR